MNTDLVVANLDRARVALIEAKTIQDTKKVLDVAAAAEIYAKRQQLSQESIDYAHSIKIEALAQLGRMLKETPRNEGGRPAEETCYQEEQVIDGNVTVRCLDCRQRYKKIDGHICRTEAPRLSDLGIDRKTSMIAQKLADLPPQQFEEVKAGAVAINAAIKEVRRERRRMEVEIAAQTVSGESDRYTLFHGDFRLFDGGPFDWVITDPPYPAEYLPLYEDLSYAASKRLKDGGSLLCMTGQTYLPQVIEALSAHLTYHWTIAYVTPGGQAVQQFQRKVNAFWKPVLWFTKGEYRGDWIGDVTRSAVNDNDKLRHHWGQSESGMYDLMARFVRPGHSVFDPFMGAGTTGVIALELGASFAGCDVSEASYNEAKVRLAA